MSADLADLLIRCLAKQPEQRPPTAEALDRGAGGVRLGGRLDVGGRGAMVAGNIGAVEALPASTMAEKTLVIAPRT